MLYHTNYYYALVSLAGAIFLIGAGGNLVFWLSGAAGSSLPKTSHLFRGAVRSILSGRAWGAFLVNGLLQKKLLAESKLRWLMSMSFTWGAIELFFVGSLGNMIREDAGTSWPTYNTAWFAAMNEVGGLLLLLGVSISCYRRFIIRSPQLKAAWDDGLIIGWLALIVMGGYFLEATRLLSVPGDGDGASFVGYGISRMLHPINASWASVHTYLWWAHVAASLSLVAYLPYSKLFHMLASPLAMMARSFDQKQEQTSSCKGVAHELQ